MQLQLFLLFFFCLHQIFICTNALFNIELHQCESNITVVHNITTINDKIFDSCNLNCCTTNDSNQSSISYLVSSNICQMTAQSPTGVCLGRLCYSGECDEFFFSINMTFNVSINHSSIPWSSFINSTQIVWPLWRNRSYISIRYSILILLLIVSLIFTLITLFMVIKSIRHAQILAERKLLRYSLF